MSGQHSTSGFDAIRVARVVSSAHLSCKEHNPAFEGEALGLTEGIDVGTPAATGAVVSTEGLQEGDTVWEDKHTRTC